MFPGRFLEKDASEGGGDRKETFLPGCFWSGGQLF